MNYDNKFIQILASNGIPMGKSLEIIKESNEALLTVKNLIKSTIIYSLSVIVFGFFTFIGIMIYVTPKLTKVYADTGIELPALTQLIIKISFFLNNHYFMVSLIFIGCFIACYFLRKTEVWKKIFHNIIIQTPGIKILSKQYNNLLFVNFMLVLLKRNIPINKSLEITSDLVSNYYFKKEILHIKDTMIQKGSSINMSLKVSTKQTSLFLPEVVESFSANKRELKLLISLNNNLNEVVINSVKNHSKYLEIFLIIISGLMIFITFLSIMLPLFKIGQVMRTQ